MYGGAPPSARGRVTRRRLTVHSSRFTVHGSPSTANSQEPTAKSRALTAALRRGDGMSDAFAPVSKQSLTDRLARQIRGLIQRGDYRQGDRLPPIMEMARRFRVGHPTIREALKKLEAIGVVEIRHGSGVYVSRSDDVLVLASPHYAATATKKLL